MIKLLRKKDPLQYLNTCLKKYQNTLSEEYFCKLQNLLDNYSSINFQNKKDSVQTMLKLEKPLIRIGDGELLVLCGISIPFQDSNLDLTQKLIDILLNAKVNIALNELSQEIITKNIVDNLVQCLKHNEKIIVSIIDKLKLQPKIYNALLTRTKNKKIFKQISDFCKNKDVILVTSKKGSCGGYVNELYGQAKSFDIIDIPPFNAYSQYNEILARCLSYSKNILFLLSAGPTAKVLVQDLFIKGYRAIDIGHIPAEYLRYYKNGYNPEYFFEKYVKNEQK